jgi:hypothetical protein
MIKKNHRERFTVATLPAFAKQNGGQPARRPVEPVSGI